jgi:hypothetical protein
MGISAGPNSISDNLAFHIDPANPRSYAGVGTVIYDLSGNGKTSYFTNGAFYQNYQKGVVVVDGNNDYISTPLFNLTSPITVSAWVKNVVDDSPVFSASGPEVSYGNNEVIHYFSGKSILVAGNPTAGKYFQFPQLNLNQWSNLVMTRDASNNMSIYLNGIGSTSNTQSYSNILQMNQIGRYSAFTNVYNVKGSIGEVKIYNRALSASEVLQNYNASKKRYLPEENIIKNGLVLNIDSANPSSYAGTGNTAFDLSGFGNTTSLVNGTGFTATSGGSLYFDGTNDTAITTFTWPNNFTVDITFKLYANSGYFYSRIISTGNNDEFEFAVGQNNGLYEIKLLVAGWVNTSQYITPDTIETYTITRSPSTSNIYRNGVLIFTTSVATTVASSLNINLACRHSNQGQNTKIDIYNFKIYNRALSATEVMQNFNAMRERYNI